LSPIYPLDRRKNAEGLRRRIANPEATPPPDTAASPTDSFPPLLQKLLAEHAASGLPPAYIPSPPHPNDNNQNA
jgi:hypothetical protein